MSDNSDSEHEHAQGSVPRKRRTRACDHCRKRKVRCDGSEEDRRACSICVASGANCTYTSFAEPRKKRYVDDEYLKGLEAEVKALRLLVLELQSQLRARETSPFGGSPTSGGSPPPRPRHTSPDDAIVIKHEEPDDESFLEGFKFMDINDTKHVRFMGRSSHFPLVKAAIKMKQDLALERDHPLEGITLTRGSMMLDYRRAQFWTQLSDCVPPDAPYTDFPAPALLDTLLSAYLRLIHPTLPVLHAPTLLRAAAAGAHRTDPGFGAVVLLACALGARFADEPAALPPAAHSWQLAGWRWFDQVRANRKLMPLSTTTLVDLQIATLAAAYVGTLALPHTNYSIVGHGLRLAQDLGAHRRTTYSATPSVESELRKRAFWCLIVMDRGMCSILGRSCSIQDEDFDLDYPIDCDDEYWMTDDPRKAFKQPPGRPSMVSSFISYLKLTQIHSRALRNLYSLQGSKDLEDPTRIPQIVADLDSDLNSWEASLPAHLKFDTKRADAPFAAHAASLCAAYHALRIFIHRPFITVPRAAAAAAAFPSRAICTSAARACIQALERQAALAGPAQVYQYHVSNLFQTSIILLLHVWQGLRTGTAHDVARDFAHVRRALGVLTALELHWDCAGRFWDVLNDLLRTVEARVARTGACPPPPPAPPHANVYATPSPEPIGSAVPLVIDHGGVIAYHELPASPISCWPPASAPPAPAPAPPHESAPATLDDEACGGEAFGGEVFGAEYDGADDLDVLMGGDPALDALFAELFPDPLAYDDPLAAAAQPYFGAPGEPPASEEWTAYAPGWGAGPPGGVSGS